MRPLWPLRRCAFARFWLSGRTGPRTPPAPTGDYVTWNQAGEPQRFTTTRTGDRVIYGRTGGESIEV